MPRNYDEAPIELTVSATVYIYEDVDDLDQKLADFTNSADLEEVFIGEVSERIAGNVSVGPMVFKVDKR